jgi:hypothetical protein
MTGLENYVLAVVCPKFSAQMQKAIEWFRQKNEIIRPGGTTIYLVRDELIRIINDLEGAIGRLIRPAPEIAR